MMFCLSTIDCDFYDPIAAA